MLHSVLHNLIHFFIPHDGNDYRPRLLQRVGMVGMFVLVVLSFTATNMQALLWQTSDYLVGAVLPAVVVDLTNKERTDLALLPVTRNAVLDAAAQLKAEDMAKYSYFAHDSPTGVTPWYWFSEAGYPFVNAGENLAVYFTDSNEVVDAWMKSPTHRANIVNSQYREIGIGTARGMYKGFETVFVVQFFGTRAIPAPVAALPAAIMSPEVVDEAVLAVAELPAADEVTSLLPVTDSQLVLGQTPLVAGQSIVAEPISPPTPAIVPTPRTSKELTPQPEVAVAPAEVIVAETASAVIETPERVIVPGITGNVPALYLSPAASSTGLTPAPLGTIEYNGGTSAPMVARLATEPNRVLQLLYIIVGLFTGLALLTSVLLQWRQHRPVQTVYGISLLILMCGLFYIHTVVTSGVVIQ